MSVAATDLTLENGSWWFRDSVVEFCVFGEDATYALPLLQSLLDRVCGLIDDARAHANSTPYASDICDASGIQPHTIQIHDAVTYCVWFQLINAPHRYLAVKFVKDSPVDVYCDSP